ncbi:hypothetical protein [Pseudomonas sp. PLMAX]|uniref:hypothetical protein n=1 Tax=Pseudomonas sp. PLMAX TaxID=2201998 RepID=UPI0038BACFEF
MSWIKKSRPDRAEDVNRLWDRLCEESPDRFWLSDDQDSPQKQLMNIILPVRESDVYYRVTMLTAQLKAARMIAYDLGQLPGEKLAITPALLDRVGIIGEELFLLDTETEDGIAFEIVLDVEGLTHPVIDDVLGRFIDNGEVPPMPKKINAFDLVTRLAQAREEKRQEDFPI